MDADGATLEAGILHQLLVQGGIGFDAFHHQFVQGVIHARQCLVTVIGMGDKLADQRIIMGRHLIAAVEVGIHADPGPSRSMVMSHPARRRHESAGMFGVDAALNRMAVQPDVFLTQAEWDAAGNEDLLDHNIHPRHHFGDGVLHLHAGIHLDEVELSVLVEELKGAGAAVADAQAGIDTYRADAGTLLGSDAGRRGFLDHLLVAALNRTIALAQMDRLPLAIGQYLDFDVARPLQVFLHVHRAVAKCRLGLAAREHNRGGQMSLAVDHPHPAPAATRCRLDQHRIADLAGNGDVLGGIVGQGAARTGYAGHTGLLHGVDGRHLVAHQADGFRARTDEDEAAAFHPFGKNQRSRRENHSRDGWLRRR